MKIRALATTLAFLMGLTLAWGQPEGGRPPRGGQPPEGRGGFRPDQGGPPQFMGGGAFREYDTNGNMLIEDEEIEAALRTLQEESAKAYLLLLQGADKNGNGTMEPEEAKALDEAIRYYQQARRFDRNQDGILDNDEMTEAFTRTSEMTRRFNDMILDRLDQDGNGEISEDEARQARDRFRGGRDENNRDRGGDRGERGAAEREMRERRERQLRERREGEQQ